MRSLLSLPLVVLALATTVRGDYSFQTPGDIECLASANSCCSGATVDIAALGTGEDPYEEQVTDADGRARFMVPEGGAYKINVIWGMPNRDTRQAEFETIFSSLTFARPQAE